MENKLKPYILKTLDLREHKGRVFFTTDLHAHFYLLEKKYEEVDFDFKNEKFDLVVNSTSAGLKDDFLPAPKEILENILSKSSFAFDCIYGKITPFLALAKNWNNKIKDGKSYSIKERKHKKQHKY